MNKQEILERLDRERERFLDLLDQVPEEVYDQPGVSGDWSLKDVIAHISMWEGELIRMLWQVKSGQKPSTAQFRPVPVDEINREWSALTRERAFDLILDDFHAVRNQTIRRVETFTDRDLTDPNRYPWLKGKALWKWIAADSFEHEAEHAAEILSWLNRKSSSND